MKDASPAGPEPKRDPEDDEWHRQIAADVAAGRLDRLGDAALAHLRAGRTREM
ncbi:MAG TPA: hypothetical protein VLK84_02805 [Longimicrobium sp.]|nr:hypothetical protein [Longimicrobium sp.]